MPLRGEVPQGGGQRAVVGHLAGALVGGEQRVQGGHGGSPGLLGVLAHRGLVDQQAEGEGDQEGHHRHGDGDLPAQVHRSRRSL